MKKNKRVLIIKNDGIGDLILAEGVIRGLTNTFKNVDLITCATNKEIAEAIPSLNNVFYVSRDGIKINNFLSSFGWHRKIISSEDRNTLKEVQSTQYDIAIVLRRFVRQSSLVIMTYIKAREKYYCWQYPTNATMTQAQWFSRGWVKLNDSESLLESSYYKDLLKKELNITNFPNSSLEFNDSDTSKKLNDLPCASDIAVGLSGSSVKIGVDFWVNLLRSIELKNGGKIYLFGGADKVDEARIIKLALPMVVNKVGTLSLADTAEYFKSTNLYIGNDTGISHLANIFSKRTIVFLGGGTFKRFFPWGENNSVIYYGMECFDCGWRCKFSAKECIIALDPKKVAAKINNEVNNKNIIKKEYNISEESFNYNTAWQQKDGMEYDVLKEINERLIKESRLYYKLFTESCVFSIIPGFRYLLNKIKKLVKGEKN